MVNLFAFYLYGFRKTIVKLVLDKLLVCPEIIFLNCSSYA